MLKGCNMGDRQLKMEGLSNRNMGIWPTEICGCYQLKYVFFFRTFPATRKLYACSTTHQTPADSNAGIPPGIYGVNGLCKVFFSALLFR